MIYRKYVKRIGDIALAILGIILLIIPCVVVGIVIAIQDPGPAIFVQNRIGRGKKIFKVYKFRTMKMDAPHDVPSHLLDNSDDYYLKCGKFLRKYSIDELPQLLNILKGEMSFVGPRPALWNQDDLVTERDKYGANDLRPGLTGWAQINGRDELEIPVKAKFDGEYVEKMSFLFDVKCFFKTFGKASTGENVVEGKNEGPKKMD